jgi:glycosyltransferase involved in cell wall biosynthesis
VVPVCTPVGDIPAHVKPGSGFITSSADENIVVKEICGKLIRLSENRAELRRFSENAYNYAKEHFTEEKFKTAYQSLFR